MLGLVFDKKGPGQDGAVISTLPDVASEFNRLLQTGTARLPSISLGFACNAHPSIIVATQQAYIGANHAAALERVLFGILCCSAL